MNKKTIGVFCGSFNPILYSHLSIAEQLLNTGLDKIIFVPVSSKYNKSDLALDEHRYNMLKLVCDKNEKFEISDIEINSDRQPYTFETLQSLSKDYPDYELRLIIGTDNLKELYWWYKINNLLDLYKVIIIARDEDNVDKIIDGDSLLSKFKSSFVKANINIRTNLSSTYVRNLIKEDKEIKYLLPDEVIDYIQRNNLYEK